MADWTYGDEGKAFPVKEGEIWKAGQHLFACSDVMESSLFGDLLMAAATPRPTLLYCDPPWGQSLLNSFRSKAGFDKATYRWEQLYRVIADLGHHSNIPVWIEGSKPTSRDGLKIPGAIASHSMAWPVSMSWEITYYRKNLSGLYYAGTRPVPFSLINLLTGMDDDFTPGTVMSAYGPTGVVIDPCAGRGVTSRQAQKAGWGSVNNELNPFRVSAALARIAPLVGEPSIWSP